MLVRAHLDESPPFVSLKLLWIQAHKIGRLLQTAAEYSKRSLIDYSRNNSRLILPFITLNLVVFKIFSIYPRQIDTIYVFLR
jgi:hypothetical protein